MNIQKENDKLAGLVGQRLTPKRLLLLDLLGQGEHLDADELYRRVKEKEPRLSMSTVYRNLQLFLKLGLVEEHHFDRARTCYEAKTKVEHHHLDEFRAMWEEVRDAFLTQPDWELFEGISEPFPVGGAIFLGILVTGLITGVSLTRGRKRR